MKLERSLCLTTHLQQEWYDPHLSRDERGTDSQTVQQNWANVCSQIFNLRVRNVNCLAFGWQWQEEPSGAFLYFFQIILSLTFCSRQGDRNVGCTTASGQTSWHYLSECRKLSRPFTSAAEAAKLKRRHSIRHRDLKCLRFQHTVVTGRARLKRKITRGAWWRCSHRRSQCCCLNEGNMKGWTQDGHFRLWSWWIFYDQWTFNGSKVLQSMRLIDYHPALISTVSVISPSQQSLSLLQYTQLLHAASGSTFGVLFHFSQWRRHIFLLRKSFSKWLIEAECKNNFHGNCLIEETPNILSRFVWRLNAFIAETRNFDLISQRKKYSRINTHLGSLNTMALWKWISATFQRSICCKAIITFGTWMYQNILKPPIVISM